MAYPSCFYYSKKIESTRFSFKPEGTPDLERLIRQEPWWKKPGLDSVQTPKALIFADWTCSYYNPGKIEKVKQLLLALLNNQFKLFIWDSGRVKPLLKADLTDPTFILLIITPIRLPTEEHIVKAAINDQRLVRDQCLVLDYYWIDYLCFGQTERRLSLSAIEDVGLDSIDHQVTPPLTGFTIDLFKNVKHHTKTIKRLTAIAVQYPQATCQVDFRNLILDYDSLIQLMTTGTLAMGDYHFSVDDLARIEALAMHDTSIDIELLESLLEKTSNLESIEFDECTWIGKRFSKVVNLPNLKRLYLDDCATRANIVEQFLLGSPNLETLHWSGSYLDNDQHRLFNQEFVLPRLTHFHVFDKKFSGTTLRQILAHSLNFHFLGHPFLKRGKDFNHHEELMTLLSAMPVDEEISSTSLEIDYPSDDFDLFLPKPVVPQRFDVDKNFNNKPYSSDNQFVYQGIHSLRNQSMIIEKLSQFLVFFHADQQTIARFQQGICYGLSHFFLDSSLDEWEGLLNSIQNWNGRRDSLDIALQICFFRLWSYVKQYQLHEGFSYWFWGEECFYFYGEAIVPFLLKTRGAHLLANPWHAIGAQYVLSKQSWYIYDPNHLEGGLWCGDDQLSDQIAACLGSIIFTTKKPGHSVSNLNMSDFLRNGGLFALIKCSNCYEIMDQLPQVSTLPKESLRGLLLRDSNGIPAWVHGLNDSLMDYYTLCLIDAYIKANSNGFSEIYLSMEFVAPSKQKKLINRINDFKSLEPAENVTPTVNLNPPSDRTTLAPISTAPTSTLSIDYLKECLQTWNRNVFSINQLTEQSVKKRLIEVSDSETVQALTLRLLATSIEHSINYFYIASPDELVCSSTYVRREGHRGISCKGPGGPLYDFLTKSRAENEKAWLVINYDRFEADDLVRLNSLLDTDSRVDDIPASDAIQIIGLINPNKKMAYQGADFYSRFTMVQSSPMSSTDLLQGLPALPFIDEDSTLPVYTINLYHQTDWKERLLGRYIIKNNVLFFEEGALIQAFAANQPIRIENGLWHNSDFLAFWNMALIKGVIDAVDPPIPIPDHLELMKAEGYRWSELTAPHRFYRRPHDAMNIDDRCILNPGTLSQYFYRYECNSESGELNQVLGFLALHANSKLNVLLTRQLNEDEWGMLLEGCRNYQVELDCQLALGVDLPIDFPCQLPDSSSSLIASVWDLIPQDGLVLKSTDIDTTLASIVNSKAGVLTDLLVIDVSEMSASDLLIRMHGGFNSETLSFYFYETDQALLKALKSGRSVILKGYFSPMLSDALALFLQDRKKNTNNEGQLILLFDERSELNYLVPQIDLVSLQTRIHCLEQAGFSHEEIARLDSQHLNNEPLSRLKTRLNFLRNNPFNDSDAAWAGLDELTNSIHMAPFEPEKSQEKALAFNQARLAEVNAVFNKSPYVYLTGLTAVGKTSFVEKVLCRDARLYRGPQAMRDWAKDTSTQRKILYFSESNLSVKQWSEFEGLYNNPPEIIIDGECFRISDRHKIVWDGNPESYGEGRTIAPFFKNHGNVIVFEPLSQEFIYEYLLKPVFEKTKLAANALEISTHILAIYTFLCEHSNDHLLITPRELQMMALLTVKTIEDHPHLDMLGIAKQKAFQIASPCVLEKDRAEFDSLFAQAITGSSFDPVIQLPNYLLTASRKGAYDQLNDFLDLRDWRCQNACHLNETQLYGGLGGFIFEGSPASGKSELVCVALRLRGFTEQFIDSEPSSNPLIFYRIPASMQLDDKMILLLRALHEGAAVVMDEFNSCPMLEWFLNDLRMLRNPYIEDDEVLHPDNPGFFVIGTQNPVTMAGRIRPSEALEHRFFTLKVKDYTKDELILIVESYGLQSPDSEQLVTIYLEQYDEAQRNNFKPVPTLRHLLQVVAELLQKANENIPISRSIQEYKNHLFFAEPVEQNIEQWGAACNLM